MKRLLEFTIFAFRQHCLERLKSPTLLLPIVLTWLIAALPNPLGTSSLFWLANEWYYTETCLALGLLSTTWVWVSLLTDTGKPWVTEPTQVYLGRKVRVLTRLKWPALPHAYPESSVFGYLTVCIVFLSMCFALAHVCHTWLVDLPARHAGLMAAFIHSGLRIFLGGVAGLGVLWFLTRSRESLLFGQVSSHVKIDILKVQQRVKESDVDRLHHVLGDEELKNVVSRLKKPHPPHFLWMHQVAALAVIASVTFIAFAMTLPSWILDRQWGGAAVHLSLLMQVFTHVVGFAVFRRRTGGAWFGLGFAVVLVGLFIAVTNPRHPIRGVDSDDHTLSEAISIADLRVQDDQPSREMAADPGATQTTEAAGSKQPLVVVAVSGGGIRAQIWALATLCALDQKLSGFSRQTHLVTGASGGMVGATHFVASLPPPGTSATSDHHEQLINDASRDALTATFRTMILNDILGAPVRKLVRGVSGGEIDIIDRGRVLEDEWIRWTGGNDSVFAGTLQSLAASEHSLDLSTLATRNKGWRPVLTYAPAIAEEGRRLIICNQRCDAMVRNHANTVTADKVGGKDRLLSVDSIHLCDIDPNHSITLATAARLNANFPFVVASPILASPRAKDGRKDRPLHIMDGGYYDNYGVNLAARWLDSSAEFLTMDNYSGILFIQISSDNRHRVTIGGTSSILPEAGYIGTGFQKTTFMTDFQLQELSDMLNAEDPDFFRFCSLEFDGPVSLNWSLTSSELYALLQPFVRMDDSLFEIDEFPMTLREDWKQGKGIFDERSTNKKAFGRLSATVTRIEAQFKALQAWWETRAQ